MSALSISIVKHLADEHTLFYPKSSRFVVPLAAPAQNQEMLGRVVLGEMHDVLRNALN